MTKFSQKVNFVSLKNANIISMRKHQNMHLEIHQNVITKYLENCNKIN